MAMEWMDIAKNTFTFTSSSFDVGSDVVNALNFLGYFNANATNNTIIPFNGSHNFENYSRGAANVSENMICTVGDLRTDEIWGVLGIIIVFLPGIIMISASLPSMISADGWKGLLYILIMPVFPITLIVVPLYAVIKSCFAPNKNQFLMKNVIMSLTGMESAIESCCQLLLQIFTLLYGYPISAIQMITIITSFFQMTRCSIMMDNEQKLRDMWRDMDEEDRIELSFQQNLIDFIKRLPCYISTIVFRIMSLSLTMAFLRYWSIPLIGILVIELSVITLLRTKNRESKCQVIVETVSLVVSNLGVMNARSFIEDIDEDVIDEDDVENFVRRSSVATFVHHTLVLLAIMIMGFYDSEYMDHWSSCEFV